MPPDARQKKRPWDGRKLHSSDLVQGRLSSVPTIATTLLVDSISHEPVIHPAAEGGAGTQQKAGPCTPRFFAAHSRRRLSSSAPSLFIASFLAILFVPQARPLATIPIINPSQMLISFLNELKPVDTQASGETCLLTVENRDAILSELSHPPAASPLFRDLQMTGGASIGDQPDDTSQPEEGRPLSISSVDNEEPEFEAGATRETTLVHAQGVKTAPHEASNKAQTPSQPSIAVAVGNGTPTPTNTTRPGRLSRQGLSLRRTLQSTDTTCFDFVMNDVWGDGWNGAEYKLRDTSTLEFVASGTLTVGSQGTDEICLSRGCYMFRVTSGSYDSEISWTFGDIDGGAPFGPIYLSVAEEGELEEWGDVCPASAPTTATSLPTVTPAPTPAPTSSFYPTTTSPTAAPVETEAHTFFQLQNAILQAFGSGAATLTVILLADITVVQTLSVQSDVALISRNGTTVSGGGSTQLFDVGPGATLRAENITFRDGDANQGGAVYNQGMLNLKQCALVANTANQGGAVCNDGGMLEFTDCTLTSNISPRDFSTDGGGAVYNYGAMSLKHCTLTANSARGAGGAIVTEGTAQGARTVDMIHCLLTANVADFHGGAVYGYISPMNFRHCTFTANSAVHQEGALGGALLNYAETVHFVGCEVSDNTAGSYGGGAYSQGGAIDFDGCTVTANTASWYGGAIDNEGGAITLNDCTVTSNSATVRGGAAFSAGGSIEWNNCVIGLNVAIQGGVVYGMSGVQLFNGCTITANTAYLGAVLYSRDDAESCFSRCRFLGDYANEACVFYSEEEATALMFYHTQAFESGVVCSASPPLIYNSNVSIPLSSTSEDAMACESADILDYCQYDCGPGAADIGGIVCSCTADDQQFDPYVLDDKGAITCLNSARLNIPQSEFTLVVTKQRQPSSLQIVFTNAGDKLLTWNATIVGANGHEMSPWLVTPAAGTLIGCELGAVQVALTTWNLTARTEVYDLQIELTSNSLRDVTHNISVSAFVAAEAVPSKSDITITSNLALLAAAETVHFSVNPIDGAGLGILDTANQAYFATLAHAKSTTTVSCRIVYDTISGLQDGSCEIPTLVCNTRTGSGECEQSSPTGDFELSVSDARGSVVGEPQHFFIQNCPASYYKSDDDACVSCPKHADCAVGSSISDWKLVEGYWRAHDRSTDVRACRFGRDSCPGTTLPGRDPYCAAAFRGPLCSQCAAEFFMSWEGDGTCHTCAADKSHHPTLGLLGAVLILSGLSAAFVFNKCRRRKPPSDNSFFAKTESLYLLAKMKIFTLFLASQVRDGNKCTCLPNTLQ